MAEREFGDACTRLNWKKLIIKANKPKDDVFLKQKLKSFIVSM